MELVEVTGSWPGHHNYQKKIKKFNDHLILSVNATGNWLLIFGYKAVLKCPCLVQNQVCSSMF